MPEALRIGTLFKIAFRMLRKRPGLAAGRLLTITIVVAAVSAVFTVANATFLRPLPFPNAGRLVAVYLMPPERIEFKDSNPLTPLEFQRVRNEVVSLERIEGIWASSRAVGGDSEPEAIPAGRVSAGFFAMFGGHPAIGRVFTDEEVVADEKVVVLGQNLWQRRFGGDPQAVGRTMIVDGEPHVIVGVMPRDFDPAFVPSDFWTPLSTRNPIARTALSSVATFGVLREGRSIPQALGDLERTFAQLTQEQPAVLKGWSCT